MCALLKFPLAGQVPRSKLNSASRLAALARLLLCCDGPVIRTRIRRAHSGHTAVGNTYSGPNP